MTKLESRQKQLIAEKLYYEGTAKDAIAAQIKVADRTVDRWEIGLNWKEKKKLIDQKVSERLQDNVIQFKDRSFRIIRGTIAEYVKQLQAGQVEISASEIAKLIQLEKELLMPTEYQQVNFFKQENTQVNLAMNIHELVSLAQRKPWTQKEILN